VKIKITKCSLENSWYNNKVGKVFEVIKAESKCVRVSVCKNNFYLHFYVLDDDYIIVKERSRKTNFIQKGGRYGYNKRCTRRGGSVGDTVRGFENIYDDDWHAT
jgi:hypothetical protein